MFERLSPRAFAAFLADIWKERGWRTSLRHRDDGSFAIAGRRGDGKQGLLYVLPDADGAVGRDRVGRFAKLCRKRGVDVAVIATRGEFTDEGRALAEKAGVYLLDPDAIRETIDEGKFQELLRRHAETEGVATGDDPGGDGSDLPEGIPGRTRLLALLAAIDARLPGDASVAGSSAALADRLPAPSFPTDRRPDDVADVPARRVALAAVLVVALFGGGLAIGSFAVGGSGAADAPPITAVSTAPAENATLRARWNARTAPSLTANGSTYDLPEDERFVVVQLNVTNTGASPTRLRQEQLVFESDGRRYRHQPLSNVSQFGDGVFLPNDTRSVWVAFSVPAETTGGTVMLRSIVGAPPVQFVRDPDLTVGVVDG